MIVYVEGPAGAGKSSFVTMAQKLCPGKYKIFSEYFFEEPTDTRKGFETFLRNTEAKLAALADIDHDDKVILVDRGHISMIINSYVEQQHNINDSFTEAIAWYERYIASDDFIAPDLYVYISASEELILQRAKDNNWYRDDLGWTVDPKLAMRTYEEFFAKYEPNTPILRFDGARDSEDLVNEMLEIMERDYAIKT